MGRATDATRAVTQSANSIAALRAVESERADGLMKDPWARELAGARAMARADARREARTGIRGESRCARSFSTIS
jgi:O-methyltransferase involved in polyketide biosynthesis